MAGQLVLWPIDFLALLATISRPLAQRALQNRLAKILAAALAKMRYHTLARSFTRLKEDEGRKDSFQPTDCISAKNRFYTNEPDDLPKYLAYNTI